MFPFFLLILVTIFEIWVILSLLFIYLFIYFFKYVYYANVALANIYFFIFLFFGVNQCLFFLFKVIKCFFFIVLFLFLVNCNKTDTYMYSIEMFLCLQPTVMLFVFIISSCRAAVKHCSMPFI